MTLRTTILFLASLALAAGCTSKPAAVVDGPVVHPDLGWPPPVRDAAAEGALADHGSIPRPDGWPQGIYISGIPHLRTGFYPDTPMINMSLANMGALSGQEVESELQAAFSLVALPAKTPVSGKFYFYPDYRSCIFHPSSMTMDTNYLVIIQKRPLVTPAREVSFFRVGSMPMVANIQIGTALTNPQELEYLSVTFSETIDPAKIFTGLSLRTLPSEVALATTLITTSPLSAGVAIKLPPGMKLTDRVRLTVPVDVGAPSGVKLDGNYSGKAGSAPFVLEMTLGDHVGSQKQWEPTLSF